MHIHAHMRAQVNPRKKYEKEQDDIKHMHMHIHAHMRAQVNQRKKYEKEQRVHTRTCTYMHTCARR